MKIVCLSTFDHEHGCEVSYYNSLASVRKVLKSKGLDENHVVIRAIEFKLSKKGVLEMLNKSTPHYDNG